MKHNRWFQISALIIAASMIMTACAAPTSTPVTTTAPTSVTAPTTAATPSTTQPVSNANTIIIGTTDVISSLDPGDAYAIHDWEIIKNTNDTLLRWKPGELTLEPDLATDMGQKSADGLTYTYTLKSGIKFADGSDLDANVFAGQINRMLTLGPTCPNDVAGSLGTPFVDSVTATDASTLVFKLKAPVAFFDQLLATPPYAASDPKIFGDTCNLFPPAPIYGSGAWYIQSYTQNEQMVLVPNPYYTGALKPQVSQIIYRFYTDPNTMSLAVQTGEIDVAWRAFSPEQYTALKAVSGVTAEAVNGGGIRFLVLNHTMAPTTDPNVDKAIASAIDRNALADTVYGGNVTPIYSMLPPGFLGANTAFDTTYKAPNIAEAQAYLAASGYTASNPLQLDVWYPPEHYGASTAAAMQLIQQQLQATGAIQVNLQAQEWSTYVTALTGGQAYAVGILGWFFDYPDSSNYLDPFVYNKGEGTNVTVPQEGSATGIPITGTFGVTATQLVNLLVQADIEQDPTKRAQEYEQAQQLTADLVLTVPLFFVPEYIVYRDNIHGDSAYATPQTLNIGPSIEFWYSLLSKTP
jgi:peptide/nickel transport system substrate-binding protein